MTYDPAASNDELRTTGRISNEANDEQLKIARVQGSAYAQALEAMHHETGYVATQVQGDYAISLTTESAEGCYMWEGDQLVWRNPDKENAHIEVAVTDARDGRFIPYLHVMAAISKSGSNEQLCSQDLPFMWHSWLYHYGSNIVIPEDGEYDIVVTVGVLPAMRHDKQNGQRYTQPASATFESVPIKTGQKLD